MRFARNTYEVNANGRPDSLMASQELQGDDRFVYADPVFQEQITGRTVPDDPHYGAQWQWNNDGSLGGAPTPTSAPKPRGTSAAAAASAWP